MTHFYSDLLSDSVNNNDYFNSCQRCQFENLLKLYSMNLLHINACSLTGKIDEIESMLSNLNYSIDAIFITETWFKENLFIELSHYQVFYANRNYKLGGGVAIYLNNNIKDFCLNENLTHNIADYEVLTIENNDIIFCAIYRPPKGNILRFFDFLTTLLNYCSLTRKTVYIMGDFNIDVSQKNNTVSSFNNIITSYGFLNTINIHTRITDRGGSILDLCLTNATNFTSGVLVTHISDHLPIFISKNTKIFRCSDIYTYESRKINDRNLALFQSEISKIEWSNCLNTGDVNVDFECFISRIQAIYYKCFPLIKIVKKKKFKKPWMTPTIYDIIKKKNRLYCKFIKTRNQNDLKQFREVRNKLNKLISITKRDYYFDFFNNASLKDIWTKINSLLQKKSNDCISKLEHNGNTINEKTDIVNILNNHFINGPKNLVSNIHSNCPFSQYLNYNNAINSFVLYPFTYEEILKELTSLNVKKSFGPDGLHPKAIKYVALNIVYPLYYLFQLSIDKQIFPDTLKLARVTAVFKSGNKMIASNYRPISVLSVFAKIFEKLISARLINYLETHNLLHQNQYAFRKYKSTELAILNSLNTIQNAIDKSYFAMGIFFDISKAFDTISHDILLKKLHNLGIRGNANTLFSSYLHNRKQYVQIEKCKSQTLEIQYGVPQGSTLGPILFLIYINDIFYASNNTTPVVFADDTSIFLINQNIKNLYEMVQAELQIYLQWFKSNFLTLNAGKTQCILFHRKKKLPEQLPQLKLENKQIPLMKEVKYLGVLIQSDLRWNSHINMVCNKLSRNLGALSAISHLITNRIKLLLYYSFYYPYISYCILIWGKNITVCNRRRFQTLQNRFVRLLDCNHNTNTNLSRLSEKFKIHSVKKVFHLKLGLLMYDRITKNLYQEIITLKTLEHNYNTRNKNKFITAKYRTNIMQENINFTGPKIWNSLPNSIINSKSRNIFKKRLICFLTN